MLIQLQCVCKLDEIDCNKKSVGFARDSGAFLLLFRHWLVFGCVDVADQGRLQLVENAESLGSRHRLCDQGAESIPISFSTRVCVCLLVCIKLTRFGNLW